MFYNNIFDILNLEVTNMAGNDLAIRFSDEKYASKSEVMKELKTSLVDNIWANILAYRRQNYIKTTLKCIDTSDLLLYRGEGIDRLVSSFEEKISHFCEECEMFDADITSFNNFKINAYVNILKYIGSHREIQRSDALYRGLVNGSLKPNSDVDAFLLRYYSALDNLSNSRITEEYIIDLYSALLGRKDGYRYTDDNSLTNRVLVDRLYNSAKAIYIPTYMGQLVNFINNNELPFVYRACIASYYIYLIKPFASYNEEVAILLFKAILNREGVGPLSSVLPLEKIFEVPAADLNKIMNDAQRYSDSTYFLYHEINIFNQAMDEISDYLALFKTSAIRQEFYQEDEVLQDDLLHPEVEPEPIKQPEPVDDHISLFTINDNIAPEPVKEEPKVVVTPPPAPKAKEKKVVKPSEQLQPTYTGIAINIMTPELDEKEASKLEKQLLELDPLLRKGEARFYARHCVLGRNYTIQQFKKCNGCAYETARTGMDHLVELGYYRKDAIKNKFIYTPIPRR